MTDVGRTDRCPARPADYRWALMLREHGLRDTVHHVALALACTVDPDGGSGRMSQGQLAAAMGRNQETVKGAMESLHELGWLDLEPKRGTAVRGYRLTLPEPLPPRRQTESRYVTTHRAGGSQPDDYPPERGESQAGGSDRLPPLQDRLPPPQGLTTPSRGGQPVDQGDQKPPPPTPSTARDVEHLEQRGGGGGGDSQETRRSPATRRAAKLLRVALEVTDLGTETLDAIERRTTAGWTTAQVVTAVLREPPRDGIDSPRRFARARLDRTTDPPSVDPRPPRRLALLVEPADGWGDLVAAYACDLCGADLEVIGDDGWCDEHEWRPLNVPAAAS